MRGKNCQSLLLQNGSPHIVMAPGKVLIWHLSTHLRKSSNEILASSHGYHFEKPISAKRGKAPWRPAAGQNSR